jgi:hypothetical protein
VAETRPNPSELTDAQLASAVESQQRAALNNRKPVLGTREEYLHYAYALLVEQVRRLATRTM